MAAASTSLLCVSGCVIREARIDDAEAIVDVHVRTWQVAYEGLLPDELLASLDGERPVRIERWRRSIETPESPRHRVLIAASDGRIVGFAGLGPTRDPDAEADTGEVYAIYVHPDFWDKGVGRELFTRATSLLLDLAFRSASLWVLDMNERARRFYERAGWQTDGATKSETRRSAVLNEVRYRKALMPSGSRAEEPSKTNGGT